MLKLDLNETRRDLKIAAGWSIDVRRVATARLIEQIPVLVDEVEELREAQWKSQKAQYNTHFYKRLYDDLLEATDNFCEVAEAKLGHVETTEAELREARAERDTLSALIPLYRAVDDYLYKPDTNDYPVGHCNPDRLEALRETFRGMSVDTEEANDD